MGCMRIYVYTPDMSTAAARRRLVRQLVTSRDVTSQAEIVAYLAGEGHDVTQATVSRDLQIIGATKADGDRYLLRDGPDPDVRSAAVRAVVAAAVDNAGVEGVLGTVAGDDTIIVVASESVTGAGVAQKFEQIGSTA